MDTEPSTAELETAILVVIRDNFQDGTVNLQHHLFDRIPCTKRRFFALCRSRAESWGYIYEPSEYHATGNRPFQRNHKRGYRSGPYLRRRYVKG